MEKTGRDKKPGEMKSCVTSQEPRLESSAGFSGVTQKLITPSGVAYTLLQKF